MARTTSLTRDFSLMDKSYTSPFITEDIDQDHEEYWAARRQISTAVNKLIEAATTSDIDPSAASAVTKSIDAITAQLKDCRHSKPWRWTLGRCKHRSGIPQAIRTKPWLRKGRRTNPLGSHGHRWNILGCEDQLNGRKRCNWNSCSYHVPSHHQRMILVRVDSHEEACINTCTNQHHW